MLTLDVQLTLGDFDLAVQLALPTDGVCAIYGPSGSGKTTLLRCLAGFEDGKGTIKFNDTTWLDTEQGICVAAHQRSVGYVFQDARLFEHLSVEGNLTYAQKRATPSDQSYTWAQAVADLDLKQLLDRPTSSLSGGERQRVAIARALLSNPKLLLLDEPLAAVDIQRKAELLPYLRKICGRSGIPIVFVSHALEEVGELANHVTVVNEGCVILNGSKEEVLAHPNMQHLANRIDAGTPLAGEVVSYDAQYQILTVSCAGQLLALPSSAALPTASQVQLYIRSRDVSIAKTMPGESSIRNRIPAQVARIEQTTEHPYADITLKLRSGQSLVARITRASVSDLNLAEGDDVIGLVKSASFDSSLGN